MFFLTLYLYVILDLYNIIEETLLVIMVGVV